MAKKSKNTPRELDINAVAQQLAQTAGIAPSLFPQIYDDALVQHAMEYQASQPQEARQMSPFAQATINAAFAESPAVMTAAGGVSPRVAAIVEKYGIDNVRNHFAGGREFSREEDERQRLAEKKAEAIQRFRAWIPDVENAAKVGYDAERDRWYPYASVEGGPQTIQYGLKLEMANPALDALLKTQLDEAGKGYITSEQANGFLDEDIERRYNDAKRIYDKERGTGAWDRLSPYSQSLLVDYQYNPGLSQFRNMMNGYDTGNKAQIQAEIGRTYTDSLGVRHPLKDRNEKMKIKTDSLETFYPIFDPFVVK